MRILLADDQRDVRLGLRVILEQQMDLEVVAETTTVNELLGELQSARPDIVLLDWELPDMNRIDIISELHLQCPELKVIALSGRPDEKKVALMIGADGFVCKCDQPEKLIEAINEVSKKGGKKYATY